MTRFRTIFVCVACAVCFQTAFAGWSKQNAGTLAWLRDVYFFDERHGLIAGSRGTLLETRDGGGSWTKRKNFTADDILQIYFSDAENGWLLCERDIYNRGANAANYLLKTTDGGASWEKIEFKDAGRARVTRIFFNRQGRGFAIGEGGAVFESTAAGSWEKSAAALRYLLLDGAFFENGGAIVGAAGSVFFTEDGGARWNPAGVSEKRAAKLNSVFFVDRENGWTVGAAGAILRTSSGGKTWRAQDSKTARDLTDVYFKNAAEGWAVGADGTILHTQTGGNVWVPEETGVTHRLEKVIFAGRKGFAVGFGGTILVYE